MKTKESKSSAASTLSYLNYFNPPQFPNTLQNQQHDLNNGPGIWNKKTIETKSNA